MDHPSVQIDAIEQRDPIVFRRAGAASHSRDAARAPGHDTAIEGGSSLGGAATCAARDELWEGRNFGGRRRAFGRRSASSNNGFVTGSPRRDALVPGDGWGRGD
jgi:hypothetical protein